MLALLLALACWLGCASAPVAVKLTPGGVEVHAPDGIVEVELLDPQGRRLLRQRPPAPVADLELMAALDEPGAYTVVVVTERTRRVLPLDLREPPPPFAVEVEAPVGQGREPLRDPVELLLVDGEPAQVALVLTARRDGPASLRLGEQVEARPLLRAGERLVLLGEVDAATPVEASFDGERRSADIVPRVVSAADLHLSVTSLVFPAHATGTADLARQPDRVALPARWWERLLDATGLGYRPHDKTSPWAWAGVTLENKGEEAVNVVIRGRVLDGEGQPAPAFEPRLREAGALAGGAVTVLLRVPPGEPATAALPVYVDPSRLGTHEGASGRWTHRVEVIPLGSRTPLLEAQQALFVSRGSGWVSLGFALALLGSLGGALLVLLRGPGWLRRAPTSALMTIAMFGALTFLASALGRLLGMGVAMLLGPFATLVTNLVDDALRYTLLATLVTLLPRPGTAALAVLTHWLLTGMALGELMPTDLLFVANKLFWLEAALWAAGLTRPTGWRDAPPWARWLRLSLAFGGSSLVSTALSFALMMVLYRLFYADWYVALLLAGPGFLYVLAACVVAVPFAGSLRRIQR